MQIKIAAAVAGVVLLAMSAEAAPLGLPQHSAHDARPSIAPLEVVLRRSCRPGMRWSTYHRKCVLFLAPTG
jgi:hypothetical protein